MTNSICVAYRNRLKLLQPFVSSLAEASKNAQQDHELVLVDLGSPDQQQVKDLLADSGLPFVYIWVNFTGPFWKTKALNCAVLHARHSHLTFLDADVIVSPCFLRAIEEFHETNDGKKLGFRVKNLDPHTTNLVHINPPWVKNVFQRRAQYPSAYEIVGGHPTGNSQFSLSRQSYFDLGGYDETYCGYGLEDHDFLERAFLRFGPTIMHETADVFHQWHWSNRYDEKNWYVDEMIEQNRRRYFQHKAAGFPKPPMEADWGIFPS